MDIVESFKDESAFNSVVYSITNRRTDFSETALIYLDETKEFFGNIVKSLESIIDKKKYFIVEDLSKLLKLAGYKCSNPSKKDIKKMADGFRNTINQLDELRQNPNEFYRTKEAHELSIFCEKIRDLHTKRLYPNNIEYYEMLDS